MLRLVPLYVIIFLGIILLVLLYVPDTAPLSIYTTSQYGLSNLYTILQNVTNVHVCIGHCQEAAFGNTSMFILIFSDFSNVLDTFREITNHGGVIILAPCAPVKSLGIVQLHLSQHQGSIIALTRFLPGASVQIPELGHVLPIVNASKVELCNAKPFAYAMSMLIIRKRNGTSIMLKNIPVVAYCKMDRSTVMILPTCYTLINMLVHDDSPNARLFRKLVHYLHVEHVYIIYDKELVKNDFILVERLRIEKYLNNIRYVITLVLIPLVIIYLMYLVYSFIRR